MHLYKKSLLALGALLLSVTPAVADDIIYMKCETNTVVKAVHNLTDKVLVDKTEPTTIAYQIDLQKQMWMSSDKSTKPTKISIRDGVAVYRLDWASGDSSVKAIMKVGIEYPFETFGSGTNIFGGDKQITLKWTDRGACKEVDASVFEEALKESES